MAVVQVAEAFQVAPAVMLLTMVLAAVVVVSMVQYNLQLEPDIKV